MYLKQANDFLNKTNTTVSVDFLKNDFHFSEDKEKRDIYKITISRDSRSFSFKFGQSLAESGFYIQQGYHKTNLNRELMQYKDLYLLNLSQNRISIPTKLIRKYPEIQDLLPAISGKDFVKRPTTPTSYDILACLSVDYSQDFEDFCDSYGYDNDSIRARKIYESVVEQDKNLKMIWNDSELELLTEIN